MTPVTHELTATPPPSLSGRFLEVVTDPDTLATLDIDAGANRGTGACGLIEPRDEGSLACWLRDNPTARVLVQGALTSLTGGATPDGDTVISTRRMTSLSVDAERGVATCGPGVLLATLQEELTERGLWYPPAPTHDGASIGGNVATNAAGAATFKYGATRDWVERVRVVLRHGDAIELRRGEVMVRSGDVVRITGSRIVRFDVPTYTTPALRKVSAGYFCRSPMDLIDLFIGAEGTLGVVTEVDVRVAPRPKVLTGLMFFTRVSQAIELVLEMRRKSTASREAGAIGGLDVRSIEFFDRRCLELLRDTGKLGELGVTVPDGSSACLLFEVEVTADATTEGIVDDLTRAAEGQEGSGAGWELMGLLSSYGVVDRTELAMPDQAKRRKQLAAVREAIPLALSEWLKRWHREDPAVQKAGGDMIVPMERFASMLDRYYEAFRSRGLDVAVFGHISDGNVHPNSLPRTGDDVARAKEALLELAGVARQMGGCPLSEHGVGKHPMKRTMLQQYWGAEAIGQMRAIKTAFDPGWTLNRGVLFAPS